MVFVCAGLNVRENTDRNILNLVRRLDRNGAVIGAICTGTYVMAAAGLLEDRRCTIHWENIDGLSEEFPELDITNDLFEVDGTRVTCSGGTASLDMMLNLIAQFTARRSPPKCRTSSSMTASASPPTASGWSFARASASAIPSFWPW